MSPIGQRLRDERESKGASRVDVAQETKIAVHYLAALEYSDFKELPDAVHVKGYVRTYAEYLGLDPQAILEEFQKEYDAALQRPGEDPRDDVVRKMSKMLGGAQSRGPKRVRPLLAVGAVVVVVVFGWLAWRSLRPGDGTPSAPRPAVRGTAESGFESASESEREQEPGLEPASEPEPEPASEPEPEPASEPEREPASEPEPERFVVIREPEESTPPPPATAQARVPDTPPPSPPTTAHLSITQYGVGTAVVNRQLRGESDRFAVGDQVAFFTRVEGGTAGDRIRHVWHHEGHEMASIPLRVGSANWRTYSRKTMYAGSVGSWTVEAVDEGGNVLARSTFRCSP